MRRNYLKFILITILFSSIWMIILINISGNILFSSINTLVGAFIIMYGYYLFLILRANLVLNEKCDPVKFLSEIDKIKEISSKGSKAKFFWGNNEAAGLMTLGEFNQAKNILLNIYECYTPKSRRILLAYNINLMTCYYELGETTKAEKIFETEFLVLSSKNKKMNRSIGIEIMKAERMFFLNQLEESKEHFIDIQNMKLNKRLRIVTLYRLAQIEEQMGNWDQASAYYTEVMEKGNRLWIAKQAKMKLELRCKGL